MAPILCRYCESYFTPRKAVIRFCSKRCAMRYRLAAIHEAGLPHPKWKGGTFRSNGYVFAACPNHPKASKTGYVLEHILIAERALGKHLPEGAQIHHFDEVRSNNSNSNLVICEDSKYHMLLHCRRRIQVCGGNPDTDILCSHCGPCPRESFTVNMANWHGLDNLCRVCLPRKYQQKKARWNVNSSRSTTA